jgi:hypothetical protein
LATITPSFVKWLAWLTMIFGLPLYFTKLIHESRFAEGASFVLIYTWGLLGVVALPILLLAQFYLLIRGLKGGRENSDRNSFFVTVFALCFGVVGECVFLLSRR